MSVQKPRSKGRERLFTVFFMFAVTVVFVAAVSAVQLFARDAIKRNESLFLKRSVLAAAGIAAPADGAAVEKLYADRVRAADGRHYRVLRDDGGAVYVFTRRGTGLWGPIDAHVGLDAALDRLTGVDFYAHGETPGLGARISEPWFTEQFRGKKGPFLTQPEGTGAADGRFDAVTGATVTTKAAGDIVNGVIADAPGIVGGGR